jgi:hypothetical protein
VCGICSCSIMANTLSWTAWETSLACSTFMSHLNTDHTVIHQRWEKYSSYIMVQWTSHPGSKCVLSNRGHCSLSTCSPTVWL